MGQRTPPMTRFLRYLNYTDTGCIEWTGHINSGGYGHFQLANQKPVRAHRWYYEQLVGPIPEGLFLDHLCRNPPCVNPDHLEPVTPAENTHRWSRTITHCPKGHEYSEENTYYMKSGIRRRQCRTCHREQELARYRRKKGYAA